MNPPLRDTDVEYGLAADDEVGAFDSMVTETSRITDETPGEWVDGPRLIHHEGMWGWYGVYRPVKS